MALHQHAGANKLCCIRETRIAPRSIRAALAALARESSRMEFSETTGARALALEEFTGQLSLPHFPDRRYDSQSSGKPPPTIGINEPRQGATVLALCSLHALADKPSDRSRIEITALVSSLPGEVPTPLPTLRVAGSQLGIHLSIAFSAWCREHRRGNQHDQSGGE